VDTAKLASPRKFVFMQTASDNDQGNSFDFFYSKDTTAVMQDRAF
jgi:hypothetical protein